VNLAPAGWYPDPSGQGGMRWWDGAAWTADRSPTSSATVPEDETGIARWARTALLVAAPAQIVSMAGGLLAVRWFVDEIRRAEDTGRPLASEPWGTGVETLLQVVGGIGVVTGILFLVWFARSAANARALGLPARRTPAAGVAGFIVPVLNLWWPYGSVSDLLPDGHPDKPLVLRWFLLWVVGGQVGTLIAFGAGLAQPAVGWALLSLPSAAIVAAAIDARRIIAAAAEAHGQAL
jgi:hypothetical protein